MYTFLLYYYLYDWYQIAILCLCNYYFFHIFFFCPPLFGFDWLLISSSPNNKIIMTMIKLAFLIRTYPFPPPRHPSPAFYPNLTRTGTDFGAFWLTIGLPTRSSRPAIATSDQRRRHQQQQQQQRLLVGVQRRFKRGIDRIG